MAIGSRVVHVDVVEVGGAFSSELVKRLHGTPFACLGCKADIGNDLAKGDA
jgi:hypothetical protein